MRTAAVLIVCTYLTGCASMMAADEESGGNERQSSATVLVRDGGLFRNASGGVEVGVVLVNRGVEPRWVQLRVSTPRGADDCVEVVELGPAETGEAVCPLRSGGTSDGMYRAEVTEYFDASLDIPLHTSAAEAQFSQAELRP